MTYQTRKISVTISLESGSFTNNKSDNTLVISDAKIIASQSINGGTSGYTMSASIYGLSSDQMAKISGSGFKYNSPPKNVIRIKIDSVIFFEGIIFWARPDYSQSPDVPLEIQAYAQPLTFNNPVTDTSIESSVHLKTLLSTVGKKVGMTVGRCDADITFSGINLKGSVSDQLEQIRDAVRDHGVSIVSDLATLSAHKDGYALGEDIIELSPDSGLIGYPSFMEFGLFCTAIYNPKYMLGSAVRLVTSIPDASGDYVINYQSSHQVSSWVDNGPFFSTLLLTPKNGVSNEV